MFSNLNIKYRAWRYKKRVDPVEINYLINNLKPGDIAIDIGAHKGGYSFWMNKSVLPQGKVFSFEPHPELAQNLKKYFNKYLNKSVFIENMGLSSEVGEKTLIVPICDLETKIGSTFEEYKAEEEHVEIKVQSNTLDNYFKDKNLKIRLVKCDVEGHEMEVFKGAAEILKKDKPELLFECENTYRKGSDIWDVFKFLETFGYKGYFFTDLEIKPLSKLKEKHTNDKGSKDYVNNYLFK